MYQDFENVENPDLIPQFQECYRRAMQEAELQEMLEKGEITEEDLTPMYTAVDGDTKEDEKETNDLPF